MNQKRFRGKHTGPMTRQQLFELMEYLGYPKGEPSTKTVDALISREVVPCPDLVSQISTEYVKHNPTFRKGSDAIN